TTVRLAETVDKGVVSFVVEIIGPQRGVHGTDGRATHRLNDDLVKGEGGAEYRQVDPGVLPLFHERDTHAAGQEEEHAIGIAGTNLGDLGGVVGLAHLGVDFVDHVTFIEVLEAGQGVGAGGVVGCHQNRTLETLLAHVSPHGAMHVVVLVGHVEVVFVAHASGQIGRTGVGRQVESPLACGGRNHGHGQVGPDDTGQDIDVVALHE